MYVIQVKLLTLASCYQRGVLDKIYIYRNDDK